MRATTYGPEKDFLAGKIDLKKVYEASLDDGRKGKAMWLARPTVSFGRVWHSTSRGGENSGLYALTYAVSPKASPAELRIGTSGPVKAWLDGTCVLDTEGHDFSVVDQFVRPIRLDAGRNQLFLKLSVATGFCENFVRITDEEGTALPDVTYAVPDVPTENEQQSDFLKR